MIEEVEGLFIRKMVEHKICISEKVRNLPSAMVQVTYSGWSSNFSNDKNKHKELNCWMEQYALIVLICSKISLSSIFSSFVLLIVSWVGFQGGKANRSPPAPCQLKVSNNFCFKIINVIYG